MRRIEVTGEGITVTSVTEPMVSMYGKEMRPGHTSIDVWPWDEISGVSLSATEVVAYGQRWIGLTVDLTWGEYMDIPEDAEGFMDTVHELCRLSGIPVPDAAVITPAGQRIWPGSESEATVHQA